MRELSPAPTYRFGIGIDEPLKGDRVAAKVSRKLGLDGRVEAGLGGRGAHNALHGVEELGAH